MEISKSFRKEKKKKMVINEDFFDLNVETWSKRTR
jgi:hypothetical protein